MRETPDPDQFLDSTLRAQHLDARVTQGSALDVIKRLVAVQAQIPTVPLAALAARIDAISARELAALHARRDVLLLWSMRGTLHLVATEDLALVHAAVMRGWVATVHRYLAKRGISARERARNERAILAELESGPKTRGELASSVRGVKTIGWGLEMRALACRGLVVHAGRRGSEVVFDLLARHAPRARIGELDAREARREILLRYLAAYGASTPQDFAYWLGTSVREATDAFKDAGAKIAIAGKHATLTRSEKRARVERPPRLLPRFDVFVLGHRDKSRYLDPEHRTKVFKPAAVVEPVFTVGGRVAGTWRLEREGLALAPFRGAVARGTRSELEREAERIRKIAEQNAHEDDA